MKKIFLFILCFSFGLSCTTDKTSLTSTSQFYTDSLFSKHLNEYRKHNIYLPKGIDKSKKYPIIYQTDGNEIKENNFIKKTLDSLIDAKLISPIIVVESHSNSKIADSTSMKMGNGDKIYLQYRNFEYINDHADLSEFKSLKNRFENHMSYFKDELIPRIEKEFNQTLAKDDRYFFGVSNGAGFGMELLNRHPNLIGTYLCFSDFGGGVNQNLWNDSIIYPNLHYIYGKDEPLFLDKSANKLREIYKNSTSTLDIIVFEGGHDYTFWNTYYIQKLKKLF